MLYCNLYICLMGMWIDVNIIKEEINEMYCYREE